MRRCLAVTLTLLLSLNDAAAAELSEIARVKWRDSYEGFGSYSGLELNADGTRFATVSDKGTYAVGQLVRDEGTLTDVEVISYGPLLDPKGAPVRRWDIDAEGLTMAPDGTMWVSFEANHRVWGYTDFALAAQETSRVPGFAKLQNNSSLETLASDGQGRLYTIPERSGKLTRPFPVYRYETGRWSEAFSIPRNGKFLVVGAEFGPDRWLYLLERHFTGLAFRSRIRRFQIEDDQIKAQETLLESTSGRYDNLEGIDVWRDALGNMRITCISDDNNSFFQHTQFVEFILKP